jgi:hypothetical protein
MRVSRLSTRHKNKKLTVFNNNNIDGFQGHSTNLTTRKETTTFPQRTLVNRKHKSKGNLRGKK